MVVDDEWYYESPGIVYSEIELMINGSFEDRSAENKTLSSPMNFNEADALMNLTEIL